MEKQMHFKRMDLGTAADFQLLKAVHERALTHLPDFLYKLLKCLDGDHAYNISRYEHSLQCATRALRDNASEELIVVALFHDIGESMGPMNHGDIAAAILHPFISEDHYNLLKHHALFQTYFYGACLGLDPNARDIYKKESWYEMTVEFCAKYDEVSFDPDYKSEPLETFDPIVRRILNKPWLPPTNIDK